MIDKKASRHTEPNDEDMMDVGDHKERDSLDEEDLDEGGEADAQAMVARQKRNGLIMTYGTGAAFLLVVGLMTYPHFKKQFFSAPSAAPVVARTALPFTVRKNYFPDAGQSHPTDASLGAGPSSSADTDVMNLKTDTPLPGRTVPVAPPLSIAASSPSIPLDNNVTHAQPPVSTVPDVSSTSAPEVPASPADEDIKAMKADIQQLKTDSDARATDLQQVRTTLEGLQKQIADLATVKPNVAQPPPVANPRNNPQSAAVKWQLRSAVDGMALLGKSNSSELKRVSVGDMVSGLGKITSINEQDGHWVVQATGGSISQ